MFNNGHSDLSVVARGFISLATRFNRRLKPTDQRQQ